MSLDKKFLEAQMLYEKKIKDLEAKLAEMTEKYNACQEARKLEIEFNKQDKAELKQQLAEKDKEIESLITDLQKALALIKEGREIVDLNDKALERTDQDKISFSVEQLEKVKESLNDYDIQEILSSSSDPYGEFDENCVTTDNINTIIDNQIKQLKEMK